ncbi:MAG: DUF882 domain-containing protein [Desulfobacteraceae bacterium]|nr:MAG: DUF882 domain-containing protein [Desulfobacteraceae bacterium]
MDIFRGLKFPPNTEIGENSHFWMDTNVLFMTAMMMVRASRTAVLLLAAGLLLTMPGLPGTAAAQDPQRFFYTGDGRLHLVGLKSGKTFSGRYRAENGLYDSTALLTIQKVFDAPADTPLAQISLRLIEFIDFLQDHFKPAARIEISSGWRSPAYNTHLRETGRLAASASLHQYGMAADIRIAGVASRRVWDYVRQLGFGGAGYYHGSTVHVDVGPARSWDEKTSGVGTDISTDNKLICLNTDFDIYRPGEALALRFTRMTAFPIGILPEFVLEKLSDSGAAERTAVFRPTFAGEAQSPCAQFADIGQLMNIRWHLPDDLPGGRYVIRAVFCNKDWEYMPAAITTPVLEIR